MIEILLSLVFIKFALSRNININRLTLKLINVDETDIKVTQHTKTQVAIICSKSEENL